MWGREKEGVLQAEKASAAARATSPPFPATDSEFRSRVGRSGVMEAWSCRRESLAIWLQRNPSTLCSPKGGWCGEKSPSIYSSRGALWGHLPVIRSQTSPPNFVAKNLGSRCMMLNRNMETEIWRPRNREAFYFLCQAKGRHSRLAPQELCPPLLGNYRDSYRGSSQSEVSDKDQNGEGLAFFSFCIVSKQSPLASGNPVIGSGSLVIGSVSFWIICL